MPKYLTVAQVAQMLGVDKGKVLAWLNRGELFGIRLPHHGKTSSKPRDTATPQRSGPRRWRIPAQAVEDFGAANSNMQPETTMPAKRTRKRQPVAATSEGRETKKFY